MNEVKSDVLDYIKGIASPEVASRIQAALKNEDSLESAIMSGWLASFGATDFADRKDVDPQDLGPSKQATSSQDDKGFSAKRDLAYPIMLLARTPLRDKRRSSADWDRLLDAIDKNKLAWSQHSRAEYSSRRWKFAAAVFFTCVLGFAGYVGWYVVSTFSGMKQELKSLQHQVSDAGRSTDELRAANARLSQKIAEQSQMLIDLASRRPDGAAVSDEKSGARFMNSNLDVDSNSARAIAPPDGITERLRALKEVEPR